MCSWMEHVCFWKINNQDYFLQQDNKSLPYIFSYYFNLFPLLALYFLPYSLHLSMVFSEY